MSLIILLNGIYSFAVRQKILLEGTFLVSCYHWIINRPPVEYCWCYRTAEWLSLIVSKYLWLLKILSLNATRLDLGLKAEIAEEM